MPDTLVDRINEAAATVQAARLVTDRALVKENGEADQDVQSTIAYSLEAAHRLLMDVVDDVRALEKKEAV